MTLALRSAAALAFVLAAACSGSDDPANDGLGPDAAGSAGSGSAAGSAAGGGATAGSAGTAGQGTSGAAGTAGAAAGKGGAAGSAGAAGPAGAAGTAGKGGSAGSASAGAAGAGGGTGSGDPCANRTICEGFEGVAVGEAPGAPWKVRKNKGQVAVDDTRAFSGKRSLKVSIDATTSSDTYRQAAIAISGAPLVPLPKNATYGRMMIWTDRIPDKTVHWTIAHGEGPVPGKGVSATYNYGGMGGLMANYYSATKPVLKDCWQSVKEDLPTNAWACVAFRMDGAAAEMDFWLDGQEVSGLHVFGNQKTDQTCTEKGTDGHWDAPDFNLLFVGWESYQHDAKGAHTAWIDDVVFDDQPIGCPTP